MALLNFLYDNGRWLSVLGFAGGSSSLPSSSGGSFACARRNSSRVFLSEQSNPSSLPKPGGWSSLSKDRFSQGVSPGPNSNCAGGDGLPLKGHTTLFRAHSFTFSRIRMEMESYELPMPGCYELLILNSGTPQPAD